MSSSLPTAVLAAILVAALMLLQCPKNVEGIAKKYLIRANSSLIVTQARLDGSDAKAVAYVTDNVEETITEYGSAVTLPAAVQPTAEPSVGTLALYERIAFCSANGGNAPVLLHVNQTKRQIVTSTMNPLQIGQCRQMLMADVTGDGIEKVAVLSAAGGGTDVELIVMQTVDNSSTQSKELYRVKLTDAIPSYKYKMTSGKFNQDSRSKDFIAITAFTQTSVLLWVLGITAKNFRIIAYETVAENLYNLFDYTIPMDSVVAYLNDDSGGGTSTLVIAYQESIAGTIVTIKLKSYQIQGGRLVESAPVTASQVAPSAPPVNISLTVGLIQGTSQMDTVVMAMGPYSGPFHVYALRATNGHLDGHTLWTYTGSQTVFSNMHQVDTAVLPQSNMIAVMDTYITQSPTTEQSLYLLKVGGSSIEGKILQTWTNSHYSYGYVTSGNMIGLNVFLGPETHYTASQLKNLLVFLEAPPYHFKFSDGYDGPPSVMWSTSSSNTTRVSMKSTQTWTSSETFKASLGLLESSVSHGIEDSTQKMVEEDYEKQVTFEENLQVKTTFDAALVVRRMTFYITEIPVFIGKKPSGHILVVQPLDQESNNLFVTSGSNLYYNASHMIGDVRTYPWTMPSNMNYSIYTVSGTVAIGLSFERTVTVEIMQGHEKALTREQTTKVETDVDLKFPFSIGDVSGSFGFSYSHSDSYSNTSVNTSQTQLTTKLEIVLSIPGYMINPGITVLNYDVNPYIFWDPSGLLHIAWSVGLPKNDWDPFITHPDPALLLPYSAKPFQQYAVQYVVFELFTTPREVPTDGSSVLINVIVHNYSYKPALDTVVQFYWAPSARIPPNLEDDTHWKSIGNRTIPTIGGFSQEAVSISWYPQQGLKSAVIIVKLVPKETDYDEGNNVGYSVWPQDENNPFRVQYRLESSGRAAHLMMQAGYFKEQDNMYDDKITDLVAFAESLYTLCEGSRIGRYIHQQNCFSDGGHCCASYFNGKGRVMAATNSNAYCGYCFSGRPSLEDIPEDVYTGFGEVPTPRCSGKQVGRYSRMHSCINMRGACCASKSNGEGIVKKAEDTLAYCGYCFTGRPEALEDNMDEEIAGLIITKFVTPICSGKEIGHHIDKQGCLGKGGQCCASKSNGRGTVSQPDESNDYCGYCFIGRPEALNESEEIPTSATDSSKKTQESAKPRDEL